MTGAAAGQAEQGATVQQPLKAAPPDKGWLEDMESIRNSGAPGDFWLPGDAKRGE